MKFFVFLTAVFLFQNIAAQDFNKYFTDGSLRFDYYRTGNAQKEIISNDEMFHEPFWGGSHKNLIDTFDLGNYKFEVRDSLTGTLIYSRGFSSLFREWRFTPEAKKINRSFSETVVFPFPKNTVKLLFYNRKHDGSWGKEYACYINPDDYFIIKRQNRKERNFKIHGSRTPDKALDIVLLSEGYTQEEMQKFMDDARRFKDFLLKTPPFDKLADKINVWVVPAPSPESGTDIPGKGIWKNTLFDSHFYTFGTERYLNTLNNKRVRDLAGNAPYDQIYILANTTKYGGAGIFNYYSICAAGNKFSPQVFVHEFGHAFAGLGDEYYDADASNENFYDTKVEPWEPNLTTLVHFDKKWKAMVDKDTPIPTPDTRKYNGVTGVFEGGGYKAKGVYRPQRTCMMKELSAGFCPVCTKAILDMLAFYSE